MAIKTLRTKVDAERVGRVDAVVRQLCDVSHNYVRGLIDQGCVSVNDVPCEDGGLTVSEGDAVAVRYDPTQRYREKKNKQRRVSERNFSVVFEDEHLIVVDKKAGVLTVPTDKKEHNTVVGRLSQYLGPAGHRKSGGKRAWVIHRLDREVSGLLVFAKDRAICTDLIHQFKEHKPERVYSAIVAGVVSDDEGTFREYLATAKNLQRFVANSSDEGSERAVTHYRVERRLRDTTLVEIMLETGKRNQIRVHFAHAGHPVLGDPRYESDLAAHPQWRHKRIALHARTLGFNHPVRGEELHFVAPLPAEFDRFIPRRKN